MRVRDIYFADSCIFHTAGDTRTLTGVAEIESYKVFLDRFLVVECRIRLGSGEYSRIAYCFALRHYKIHEVLACVSLLHSYSEGMKINELYAVKIQIILRQGHFMAELTEHDNNTNESHKKWTQHFTLNFDASLLVFFNQKIAGRKIAICGHERNKAVLPAVFLTDNHYVFYQNRWYQEQSHCYYDLSR